MHVLKPNALESAPEAAPSPWVTTVTALDAIDRWTVYRRLQDLGLSCRYGRASGDDGDAHRPMTVTIHSPAEALLLWSVVRTVTTARPALADHLERCWRQRSPR